MRSRSLQNFLVELRSCLHGGRKILAQGRSEKAKKLLLYMQKFRPKWLSSGKGKEQNLLALSSWTRVCLLVCSFSAPSTRIFRAKVVYMVLGSSYVNPLGSSSLHVNIPLVIPHCCFADEGKEMYQNI